MRGLPEPAAACVVTGESQPRLSDLPRPSSRETFPGGFSTTSQSSRGSAGRVVVGWWSGDGRALVGCIDRLPAGPTSVARWPDGRCTIRAPACVPGKAHETVGCFFTLAPPGVSACVSVPARAGLEKAPPTLQLARRVLQRFWQTLCGLG